jgi:hypothetical protein
MTARLLAKSAELPRKANLETAVSGQDYRRQLSGSWLERF